MRAVVRDNRSSEGPPPEPPRAMGASAPDAPDAPDAAVMTQVFARPVELGPPPAPAPDPVAPARLAALDAFRGLTILGMLLVNNIAMGDATPGQMTHAALGRVHLADFVFPWFLLIVGVAIPLAAASRRARGVPGWRGGLKALGRALALVGLGCFLDSSALHRPVFDLNVLQLIGLAYFVAVLVYALPLPLRLGVAAGLLFAHAYILTHVAVPGVGRGVVTETQNVVAFWNKTYLTRYHLGGLTSLIPTAALALVGTALGDVLRAERLAPARKVAALALVGLLLGAAGWQWGRALPMSKPLWTASFILYTAGWGSVVLALFYAVLDARGWRRWAFPLVVFGSNAIFAYVAPIVVKIYVLQGWTVSGPHGVRLPLQDALLRACSQTFTRAEGGALYTACYVLFWWLVLLWLYRRQVFLRV